MFRWKDAYSVNIAEINKQHKELFRIGGQIADLVNANDDQDHFDEIMVILQKLEEYTIYHFEYEEKLMEQYGYVETDSHKIEHLFLIKKLKKFENKDIDTEQKVAVVELVTFISDWIAGHILKTDMKYKEFFNSRGLK
ncbi:MAG: bacteriohemerythrin [Lutispora sp.]|nr:bacteriohemerythrin [Lutispora sp.]